jgi:sec-independent protein translocase protein TatA
MYNSILLFMNMGTPEILMILFVVLLLFGGKKLPELARGLGKGIREFKDASDGVKREIHNNINNVNDGMDLNHTPSKPESYGSTPNYNNTPETENNLTDTENPKPAH